MLRAEPAQAGRYAQRAKKSAPCAIARRQSNIQGSASVSTMMAIMAASMPIT